MDDNGYIVGLGASAGGLDSLKLFFKNLPQQLNASYVVVTHLPVNYQTRLDIVLAGFTSLPVTLLKEAITPQLNHVYVLPGQFKVYMKQGRLVVLERGLEPVNRTIDEFFFSLATAKKEKAIGIIFSGSGGDGAKGINEIHHNGGIVFVQDPESSAYRSMPDKAIGIDHPDKILKPDEMGKKLLNLLHQQV